MENPGRYILRPLLALVIMVLFSCSGMNRIGTESDAAQPGTRLFFVPTDPLGNRFDIGDRRFIRKINAEGTLSYEYAHPFFGAFQSVDVGDPYKILLFYQGNQQLVLLDNTLSELGSIDLSKAGDSYFMAALHAQDGNFWLWDSNKQLLVRISEEAQRLSESFPLYQEGFPDYAVRMLAESQEGILCGDPDRGVLWYDHLGNFKKQLPLEGFLQLFFIGKRIVMLRAEGLYAYDPDLFEETLLVAIPRGEDFRFSIHPQKDRLLVLDKAFRVIREILLTPG